MSNHEIGFRSGNRCARVEERTRVTTSTRTRKGTRWCLLISSKGTAHSIISNVFVASKRDKRVIGENGSCLSVIFKNSKITANGVPNFVVKGMKCEGIL